ncbi:MAG: GntR family transcriptional regulator, partial [Synergistaceae bacterium]|nr:GntR family transcriptional regulator [Synergistaceae bacterium]
ESTGEHDRIIDLLAKGDFKGAAEYIRDVHWSFAVQERYIRKYYFGLAAQTAER